MDVNMSGVWAVDRESDISFTQQTDSEKGLKGIFSIFKKDRS